MKGKGKIAAFFTTTLIATAGSALPAMAQAPAEANTGTAVPQTSTSASDFSERKLEQFVAVSGQLTQVAAEYNNKLTRTESAEGQERVRQEANDEMITVVRDGGLTVDDYNEIAQAAQQDPALAQRLAALSQ